jgi:flagellar operon protein
MIEGIGGLRPPVPGETLPGVTTGSPAAGGPAAGQPSFDALLQQQRGDIQFSRHALRRIEQRGLTLDADKMRRLKDAVGQAEQKGSRDSLVLLDEMALVVSIQNHTVVTAMDGGSQKGNVFTNIDSVVIAH